MIDARGLSCPLPVVMTKKALKESPSGAAILVDNECAVENISRFAANHGYAVAVAKKEGEYTLTLKK